MKLTLTFLLFLTASTALADPCMKYYQNCQAESASRKYLGTREICVMPATCDLFCGQIALGPQHTTLVCGMKEGQCPDSKSCLDDNSITSGDMKDLSNEPAHRTGFDPCPGTTGKGQ